MKDVCPPQLQSQSSQSQNFQSQNSKLIKSSVFDSGSTLKPLKSRLHISLISNSSLLREALLILLKNHWFSQAYDVDLWDSDAVFNSVSHSSPHLVLLDSGIGQAATVAQIQRCRSLQPSPYVIVLELKDEVDGILDCIEAGAHGYVLQGASSQEVIAVIEQVQQGMAQCSPEVTAKLFARLAQSKEDPAPTKPPLTQRELEVLHLIAQHYSDRDIATELVIEVRTVKHHVHNILRKLNVKHRWAAAQFALNRRWLQSKA